MSYPDNLFYFPVIAISETDSTLNYLNALSNKEHLQEFTTVRADFQTSGRGQRGNGWEAEPGKNLLFSFIIYPDFLDIKKQFIISQIVSLSIVEALSEFDDFFSIKWPNDIYWKDYKICGTLIENNLQGSTWKQSITGIGININQKEFKSNAPNPVSLYNITGKEHDVSDILQRIMRRFISYYNGIRQNNSTEEIIRKYHNTLYRSDGFYVFRDEGGTFMAEIEQILPEGNMVLKDESGKRRMYAFKEVEFVVTT